MSNSKVSRTLAKPGPICRRLTKSRAPKVGAVQRSFSDVRLWNTSLEIKRWLDQLDGRERGHARVDWCTRCSHSNHCSQRHSNWNERIAMRMKPQC